MVGNVLVSGKLTPLQARRRTGVAENNLDASQINEINLNIIRGKYIPGRLKGKARPLCGNRNIEKSNKADHLESWKKGCLSSLA